jgi:membrane carboxypeptidase/penicillin-binding protein
MDKVISVAKAFGVGDYPPYIAYSLGAGDTTVLRMVNAYSILANQGRSLKPTMIDFVQDRHGKVIWKADNRPCEGCNARDWDGKADAAPAPALGAGDRSDDRLSDGPYHGGCRPARHRHRAARSRPAPVRQDRHQ